MREHTGPMDIGDFVDLIHRNAYKPNIRFISSRWGARNGAPANTCTLLVGAWLPVQKSEDVVPTLDPEHVTALNVPVPWIPEQTVVDPKTQRIVARGWRALLRELLLEHVIRPSHEVRRLLGPREYERIQREGRLGCA